MPRKKQYQWQAGECAETPAAPSRSEKKRRSLALQELGEALTRLAPQEVRELNLPPDLAEALALYARIRDREGRRRQLQFIGRLMRGTDPAPIRAALEARRAKAAAAAAALHTAEQWRDRLLAAAEEELPDLLARLPRTPETVTADGAEGPAPRTPRTTCAPSHWRRARRAGMRTPRRMRAGPCSARCSAC
jgi:ribosome-associated protein